MKKILLKIKPKEPTKDEYRVRQCFRTIEIGESFSDYILYMKEKATSIGITLDDVKGHRYNNYSYEPSFPSALVFTADSQISYEKSLKSYQKRHDEYTSWYNNNKDVIEEELLRRKLAKEALEKKQKEAEEKKLLKELKSTQEKLKNLRES